MPPYNLLIITPDQLRADYLGCYGHPTIGTQHLDALASQGVRFERCYCAAPLCGPSRISFATSTRFSEHNHRGYGSMIDYKVPNIVSSLKNADYRAGMFGKNHLFQMHQLSSIWDELDEICLGNYDGHPDSKHSWSAFPLADDHEYNITARLTTETIDFMTRSAREPDKPFLAWVNYQDPHPAYTCPEPYFSMFDPEEVALPAGWRSEQFDGKPVRNATWRVHSEMPLCSDADMRRAIATYMGQVRYVDDSVGQLIQCLEREGLAENTLVLFFSDHGELLGDHGMTHKNPTFYDSLCRIPVIMRHPEGKWRNTTFAGLVEEVDIAPTILNMLGIDVPPTMVGLRLDEAMDRGDDTGRENILVEAGGGAPTCKAPIPGYAIRAPFSPTDFGPGAMVRCGKWKLSIYADDQGELYDIENDPHEMTNLFDSPEHKAIREELTMLLLKRVLGVKVRDVGMRWPAAKYPIDVRFEPLE